MEATGSNGQFYAYNTYATPPATNPLFQGFSRSQNVNKEIIRQQKRIPQIQGFPWICGIFLLDRKLRRQIIFEQITGQGV
ncbi:hypothetical protein I6E50_11455 [Roseburia hominis]|uniref:hypothetical protein n=1 Tax=Roseburia hominis TaxID=301301 RepID=UPI001F1B7464|nr:hypothetical protein [Roseburia hominis]